MSNKMEHIIETKCEDWDEKIIKEVCELKSGTTISTNLERSEGDVLYVKVGDMTLPGNEIDITTSTRFVNSSEIKPNQIIPNDAIIFPKRGGAIATNKKRKIIKPTIVDLNTMAIIPGNKIDAEYFFHWFQLIDLNDISNGTSIPQINNYSFDNVKIHFPKSKAEQQRIVKVLNECFAAIDKAKANTEKNLKNAKELFESYLQGVFEAKGEGWEEKKLGELAIKIGSGSTPRGGKENYKEEGISLVRSMNVHDMEFRFKNLAFIDNKQAKELDGVTLQENDVLLNITGASVARCCIFPKEYLPARVNQHVSIIRPKDDIINAEFLNLLITSKPYKNQLLTTGEQGATRQAITKTQIEAFEISFPNMDEQLRIVAKLKKVLSEVNKLVIKYNTKLEYLEELKSGILKRAFENELVTEKAVEV